MKKICMLLILSLLISCDSPQENTQAKVPVVYTTFYPTAYFTQRIAKDYAKVVCPVPEDEDAIFWEAYKYPDIIQKYQQITHDTRKCHQRC